MSRFEPRLNCAIFTALALLTGSFVCEPQIIPAAAAEASTSATNASSGLQVAASPDLQSTPSGGADASGAPGASQKGTTANEPAASQGGTTANAAAASASHGTAVVQPPSIPQMADVYVNGIELRNPDSSRSALGAGLKYVTDQASLSLYTQLYNATAKELLKLYAGSTVSQKRSFRGYDLSVMAKPFLIGGIHRLRTTKHFETGKNIHLGMSEGAVESILGKPSEKTNADGAETIHYLFNNAADPFLQYYRSSSYQGQYTFKHGGLNEAKVTFTD